MPNLCTFPALGMMIRTTTALAFPPLTTNLVQSHPSLVAMILGDHMYPVAVSDVVLNSYPWDPLPLLLCTLPQALIFLFCSLFFRCLGCCAVITHCGLWERQLWAQLVAIGTARVVPSTHGSLMMIATLSGIHSKSVSLILYSFRNSLLLQPFEAGPQRHSITLILLPLQANPTWDDLRHNRMNNLYFMVLDPLRNDRSTFHTYAGDCFSSCTSRDIVKMGDGFSTAAGTGFCCRTCCKCWWFHPLPCRLDNDPASLSAFLWDDEYKSRVPTDMWLRWLCDSRVERGVYYYQVEDANYHPVVPARSFTPPKEPCPGYTTNWPEGILNFTYGL